MTYISSEKKSTIFVKEIPRARPRGALAARPQGALSTLEGHENTVGDLDENSLLLENSGSQLS